MVGPGATGSDEGPRAYFDRVFAEADGIRGQAIANLAFAQLSLEEFRHSHPQLAAILARPDGAADVSVLRIVLSSARVAGIVPDTSTAAMEEAERRLAEGHYMLWPPGDDVVR